MDYGIIKDVLVGLTTGVAASYTYEWFVASRRSRELKKQFERLQGKYAEYERKTGSTLTETRGTITLTYQGRTKFTIDATSFEGKRVWRGELFMREEAGVIGAGFYSYDGQDDTGILRVIHNPVLNQIDVSGENKSHPEGVRDFKMVWKRK
jgi:hypothetical protein